MNDCWHVLLLIVMTRRCLITSSSSGQIPGVKGSSKDRGPCKEEREGQPAGILYPLDEDPGGRLPGPVSGGGGRCKGRQAGTVGP